MNTPKILVITPVAHLPEVANLLREKDPNAVFLADIYRKVSADTVIDYLMGTSTPKSFNTIVCNPNQQSFKLDKRVLDNKGIKTIVTCSTGTNHIDMDYCKECGIEVLSLKDDMELLEDLWGTAELAAGLMFSLMRKIPQATNSINKYKPFEYLPYIGTDIRGKTLGIIGYGRLGKMMASIGRGLGMKVMWYDPHITHTAPTDGVSERVFHLDSIYHSADVISYHVHVAPDTTYMLNEAEIFKMKKKPYIINTSRGEIVSEYAILSGLSKGLISGYGADVLECEFEKDLSSSPLIGYCIQNPSANVIITPHIGGMTVEGQNKAYKWAINKLS